MTPKEYRDRSIALCIAPAVFQPRGLWKEVFHFYCKGDFVTQLQKVTGVIPNDHRNVSVLDPGDDNFNSRHSFSNATFKTVITDIIDEYVQGFYD